jgi:hypothetical protein
MKRLRTVRSIVKNLSIAVLLASLLIIGFAILLMKFTSSI